MTTPALGIADELIACGAADRDIVMIDEYDFDFFSPDMTNPYTTRIVRQGCYVCGRNENKRRS
jgi:hypothetical protein